MKPRLAVIENNLLSTLSMREKLMDSLSHDFDITVFSTGNTHQKQLAIERGLKVVDIGTCKQNPVGIFIYLLKLNRHLRNIKPDVVLTFTIRPAIWGNLLTRVYRIPTITTITGTGPLFTRKSFTYSIAKLLYRFALRKTKKVFFQNEEDRDLFIRHGYVNPAVTDRIPGSGVDTEHFSPAPVSSNGKFRFLFIGRLVRDKGIHEFVQASILLREKLPDAEFSILGPYWQQNLRRNTITRYEIDDWQAQGYIKYLGHADDIRPFLSSSDCIVLPSYREGLNNVLLEACSMERPCITTNVTGCRDIIEDGKNGLLCKPESALSLAEKMEIMMSLSPEKRSEMGRNGRQKVMRDFDKRLVIQAYKSTIKEILS